MPPKVVKVPKSPRVPKTPKPILCFYSEPTLLEAGVDEAGYGPSFGPLFVGLVVLPKTKELPPFLGDSKCLTPNRRAVLRTWIETEALHWQVESASVDEINRTGVLEANFRCMRTLVDTLVANGPSVDVVLIDGKNSPYSSGNASKTKSKSPKTDAPLPVVTMIGGDAKNPSIAAASILAKEHHDEWIRAAVLADPTLEAKYGLSTNLGYHTPKHAAGLLEHGPTLLHREKNLRNLYKTDHEGVKAIILGKTS